MSLPVFTKTAASAVDDAMTVTRANQGQGCAVAIVEGMKSIERLVRYLARSTATGANADYDVNALAISPAIGVSDLDWNGAADVTFRGFLAGYDGEERIVRNITAAKSLLITNEDTADLVAANRVLCASNYGQYLGPGGIGRKTYDGTAARWRFDVIYPGAPITPTFSAGDYTGNGSLTWTLGSGDVVNCQFQQFGKLVLVWISLAATSTGGAAATALQRTIPGGFKSSLAQIVGPVYANDNGTVVHAYGYTPGGASALMQFIRFDGAAWSNASANNTQVQSQGALQLVID